MGLHNFVTLSLLTNAVAVQESCRSDQSEYQLAVHSRDWGTLVDIVLRGDSQQLTDIHSGTAREHGAREQIPIDIMQFFE